MVPFKRSKQFGKGAAKFVLYLGKRYEPFNSLRLNPIENITHNMHKSSFQRAVNLPSNSNTSQQQQ